MYRKTYATINETVLEENVKEIVQKYPHYQYYFGVVKNNAYHHGIKVINRLIQGGVNYLAVSSLEEAIEVRKYNASIPVLILEPIDLEFLDDAINHDVTLTIESLDYLKELDAQSFPYKIKVHFKIDSGMNRLGFKSSDEVKMAVDIVKRNDSIILEGIYSHFATSGVNDYHYDKQVATFLDITSKIDLKEIPIVHLDRSLTMVTHSKLSFVNGVRLGIVMFGFSGSRKISKGLKSKLREMKRNAYLKKYHISETFRENDLHLSTAFGLYSTVFAVRPIKKGEFVGYNASFVAKEDGFIATIPIGYADGVTKEYKKVVIHGKKYPIVSDSMDMIMVLVDKSVKKNDKVEIFGDSITIKEVANCLGMNSYHLFNQISYRVPRLHVNHDETIEVNY